MIATGKEHIEKKDEAWCGGPQGGGKGLLVSIYHPHCSVDVNILPFLAG